MQHPHYYIEFVGQHTAGKTSTIREIVDTEMLAPLTVIYPQKIKRSQVVFVRALPWLIITNLKHLCFVCVFFLKYAQCSYINYHAVGRHIFKMVILHPFYERYDFDLWMKDDMLHLLPRIAFKEGVDVKQVLQEFVAHFTYRYNGLVYMDLPYDVMRHRFQARFADRPAARRLNRELVYERSFKQTLLLRELLLAQTDVPLIILDGTDSVRTNAERVVSFVRSRVLTDPTV